MKAVAYYLLCAVLAAGSVLPPRALYSCSASGQRNMPRCCCRAAPDDGLFAGACGKPCCARTSTVLPASHGAAAAKSRCCSVTHEKTAPAALQASGSAYEGLKRALAEARFLPAAMAPASPPALAPRRTHANRDGPGVPLQSPPPPIFLLHCAFLN